MCSSHNRRLWRCPRVFGSSVPRSAGESFRLSRLLHADQNAQNAGRVISTMRFRARRRSGWSSGWSGAHLLVWGLGHIFAGTSAHAPVCERTVANSSAGWSIQRMRGAGGPHNCKGSVRESHGCVRARTPSSIGGDSADGGGLPERRLLAVLVGLVRRYSKWHTPPL